MPPVPASASRLLTSPVTMPLDATDVAISSEVEAPHV
jgi:hypothetical protein